MEQNWHLPNLASDFKVTNSFASKYWVWLDAHCAIINNKTYKKRFVPSRRNWFFPCHLQATFLGIWFSFRKAPYSKCSDLFFVFFLITGGPKPSAHQHASSLHDLLNSLPSRASRDVWNKSRDLSSPGCLSETEIGTCSSFEPFASALPAVGRERRRCLD